MCVGEKEKGGKRRKVREKVCVGEREKGGKICVRNKINENKEKKLAGKR